MRVSLDIWVAIRPPGRRGTTGFGALAGGLLVLLILVAWFKWGVLSISCDEDDDDAEDEELVDKEDELNNAELVKLGFVVATTG